MPHCKSRESRVLELIRTRGAVPLYACHSAIAAPLQLLKKEGRITHIASRYAY